MTVNQSIQQILQVVSCYFKENTPSGRLLK